MDLQDVSEICKGVTGEVCKAVVGQDRGEQHRPQQVSGAPGAADAGESVEERALPGSAGGLLAGGHRGDQIDGADVVVVSPGVAPAAPVGPPLTGASRNPMPRAARRSATGRR